MLCLDKNLFQESDITIQIDKIRSTGFTRGCVSIITLAQEQIIRPFLRRECTRIVFSRRKMGRMPPLLTKRNIEKQPLEHFTFEKLYAASGILRAFPLGIPLGEMM